MNDVTGRTVNRFRNWRMEQVEPITVKTNLDTLRVFLQFCEDVTSSSP